MQQDGAKEILWIEHLGQQTLEDAVDRAIILRWVLERILKDGLEPILPKTVPFYLPGDIDYSQGAPKQIPLYLRQEVPAV